MDLGWFVGSGSAGVARNQSAAVRSMPAAVGADVVVGDGGDDVSDRDRPVPIGSGPHRPR